MRHIALSILALSSSLSFAGTMGAACTPGNVSVPCAATYWDLGIEALYLKPTYSGNQYWYNFLGYHTDGTNNWFNKRQTDWDWGFKLEGSYHFGTGSDVSVNWIHLDEKANSPGITYTSLVSGNTLSFAYNRASVRWDVVNAELGQHADFGVFNDIRFHAGVQYSNLRHNEYAPLTNYNPTTQITQSSFNRTSQTFSGTGPRVGMDLSYHLMDSFSIYGKFAGALLAGNSKTNDTSTPTPYSRSSTLEVIPEIEGKLGLAYTHALSQGHVTIDAGYMMVNYFSVFELPGNTSTATNLAFQGPYAGLKWAGNLG